MSEKLFPFGKTVEKYECVELQIREGIEDNSKIYFFLFLNKNICCDTSLELSHRDSSNDRSQNMFLWRNMDNYP